MGVEWLESPFERRSIQHGMKLRDQDGKVLGKVACIGETVLFMRQRFSRKVWAVPLARVERVAGKGVYVAGRGREALEPEAGRLHTEIVTAIYPLAEPPHTAMATERHAHA
ncbi:PRC-barrel domain containing protein [Archangium lansingense]|uniref:PRC-barrel domain containing protein n=1 Tax=Archangium lansingense TaxID=2995310 RepID=A0ABT4AKV0_9BACT|nr:PRC-barrel domain containing protein [Archangium lansinium]MCY1082323.1 PRC-barrel domain containing protein [Archangium lansinium]